MTIGQKVRAYRKEMNMTQVQFAVHCGIDYSTLVSIENNRRNTSLSVIFSICKAIGVPLYLFFECIDLE